VTVRARLTVRLGRRPAGCAIVLDSWSCNDYGPRCPRPGTGRYSAPGKRPAPSPTHRHWRSADRPAEARPGSAAVRTCVPRRFLDCDDSAVPVHPARLVPALRVGPFGPHSVPAPALPPWPRSPRQYPCDG